MGSILCTIAIDGATVAEHAVGIDGDITRTGGNLPRIVDPNAFLCTDEGDFTCIHPTQGTGINGQTWGRACVCCDLAAWGYVVICGIDVVGTCGDGQVVGPDACIDFDRPCQEVGVVTARGIQSCALYVDLPLVDLVTREAAIVQLRYACGECGAVGVDDGRAIDVNTTGVGDDEVGPLPRHFDVACQSARVAAVDLVDNDLCTARGQPRVGLDPACGLGIGVGAAVVQYRAIGLGIKLAVLVHRDPCGTRCLDVDLGGTTGGGQDGWLLTFRRTRIGNHLRVRRQYLGGAQAEHEGKCHRFDEELGD